MAGDENLKRGGQSPWGKQPHGGYLAPPPKDGKPENFEKARENLKNLWDAVVEDADVALSEVHGDLTSLTKDLITKAARGHRVPNRQTIEVLKEYRLTQERVNAIRRERGQMAEAVEFFDILDAMYNDDVALEDIEISAKNESNDLEQIHAALTALTRDIMRRAKREGKPPSRALMDTLKEFRQTSEAVNEARRARSPLAQSVEFLATVDARKATLASRVGEDPSPVLRLAS